MKASVSLRSLQAWKQSWAIARKELGAYFGSSMALIFVGAFLVVTLFSFFWADFPSSGRRPFSPVTSPTSVLCSAGCPS